MNKHIRKLLLSTQYTTKWGCKRVISTDPLKVCQAPMPDVPRDKTGQILPEARTVFKAKPKSHYEECFWRLAWEAGRI